MQHLGNHDKNQGMQNKGPVIFKQKLVEKASKTTSEQRCNGTWNLSVCTNTKNWSCYEKAIKSTNRTSQNARSRTKQKTCNNRTRISAVKSRAINFDASNFCRVNSTKAEQHTNNRLSSKRISLTKLSFFIEGEKNSSNTNCN